VAYLQKRGILNSSVKRDIYRSLAEMNRTYELGGRPIEGKDIVYKDVKYISKPVGSSHIFDVVESREPTSPNSFSKEDIRGDIGVLGCLPIHPGLPREETMKLRRANKYLIHMSRKIQYLLTSGQFSKGIRL
jgi:hypothetical protein